jgi:transcriptional regulator with XRE-family HTH domain
MSSTHNPYGKCMDQASQNIRMSDGDPCEDAEVRVTPEEAPELHTTEYWRGMMRRARQGKGLSQEGLAAAMAKRFQISQAMLSRIESGDVSSSKAIVFICDELGIPLPQFVTGDELDLRWQEAGMVLRRRSPNFFEQQLKVVETLIDELDKKG